ncbi:GIP [Symbiodinium sp. CCMP2592]|nr:GIP [Symbiodinium sp. CCMP2592]
MDVDADGDHAMPLAPAPTVTQQATAPPVAPAEQEAVVSAPAAPVTAPAVPVPVTQQDPEQATPPVTTAGAAPTTLTPQQGPVTTAGAAPTTLTLQQGPVTTAEAVPTTLTLQPQQGPVTTAEAVPATLTQQQGPVTTAEADAVVQMLASRIHDLSRALSNPDLSQNFTREAILQRCNTPDFEALARLISTSEPPATAPADPAAALVPVPAVQSKTLPPVPTWAAAAAVQATPTEPVHAPDVDMPQAPQAPQMQPQHPSQAPQTQLQHPSQAPQTQPQQPSNPQAPQCPQVPTRQQQESDKQLPLTDLEKAQALAQMSPEEVQADIDILVAEKEISLWGVGFREGVALDIDEIGFTYEREAEAPNMEGVADADNDGSTGGNSGSGRSNKPEKHREAKTVKAKTTEALAKSALQMANSNMLEIKGVRTKLDANKDCISKGLKGKELEDRIHDLSTANVAYKVGRNHVQLHLKAAAPKAKVGAKAKAGTQPAYTEYYHASTAVPADSDPGNNTYGYPLATNRMLNYRNKVLSLDNKNPKKKHVIKEITPADVINVTSYLKKTNAYSEFYKNRRSLEPVVSYVVRTCFEKEVAQVSLQHSFQEASALNNDILEKINAVEMESDLHQRIEVILDSGADDAQGKAIKTEGRRMLNLTFFDDNGSFCRIQEAFTVASVINPLMAIGKLFREGWELRVNEEEGMCLTDGNSRIPVHLHKNSLAAYAYVQTPSRSRGYSSSNYKMVRTVVQLNKHVQEAVNKEEPGWHNTDSMVTVKYATQSSYENPSLMYSPTHFPYRSTLVKEERGWRAVEVSRKYSEKADPFEEFGEGEKEVVTAISAKPIPLWIRGTPYAAGDRADQESHGRDYWKMDLEKGEVVRHHVVPRTVLFDPTGVSNCPVLLGDLENNRYTQGDCIYSTEIYEHSDDWRADRLPLREHFRLPWFGQTRFRVKPGVVEDLKAEAAAEELKKKKEEHYQEKEDSAAPPAAEESKDDEMREAQADQEAPQEVVEVLEESFYHEGVEYTAQRSSLKELQALCREYGVKTTGSKKQLLKRLATAVREERLSTQHKEQREHHQAYHLAPPQEPTEEERAYHNLTHLPYQPWCPHCVAMKAREDNHKKGSEEPPAVTLVAVDSWSKAVLAVPCKRKNVNSSRTTRLMMTPFWRNSEQVNHSQPQQKHLQHQLNQVNRAEETDGYLNMPHDDEVYEADDEFLYESEEEEEETESEPTEVFTKVPVEFFDEEKGPPNVDPDFLQKLDDEATVKEIKRLTKMGVISLVSTDPQEATENVPLVDSEQELHKWLTTKLVKDWRFREATGFEVDEATAGTTKPKQIQRITKLVPMLALANNWAIYSVDVKVNYDVDSFDEAKKEVTEKAEKLKKVEESLEKEKEELGNQKAEFEETVKRFLKKQKEALSEKETALEEAEENVKAKEAEERTVGYDQEREEYAKKYVDDVKKDLERELKVLKQEEKVRNQKLDDLQYDYKSLKDDYQYFKTYSQEVDALLLAAKDRIVKYKKKVKSLKETIGAVLSGSEGEEETDEAYKTKAEEEKEKAEAKAKEEEKKKGKKPKQVETEDPEEKPSSNQGDENTFDPNDIAEFTQLGYVWEFNKKTQEYRAKSEDKKGSTRIKNAPVKGRLLWNKVTECYRRHNVWFTDGKELDKFLETKENEKIEEEVQRRIHAKGKYDNQGTKGKGPSWDDGQNDSWWYNEQWNNENWNTTDDGSNWYENANPQNKGYWQTPEEWAQQNQWEQWTPKGKSKGKKSKNWVQTQ